MKPKKKLSLEVEVAKLRSKNKVLKSKLAVFQPQAPKKAHPMKRPTSADYKAYLRAYAKR